MESWKFSGLKKRLWQRENLAYLQEILALKKCRSEAMRESRDAGERKALNSEIGLGSPDVMTDGGQKRKLKNG